MGMMTCPFSRGCRRDPECSPRITSDEPLPGSERPPQMFVDLLIEMVKPHAILYDMNHPDLQKHQKEGQNMLALGNLFQFLFRTQTINNRMAEPCDRPLAI